MLALEDEPKRPHKPHRSFKRGWAYSPQRGCKITTRTMGLARRGRAQASYPESIGLTRRWRVQKASHPEPSSHPEPLFSSTQYATGTDSSSPPTM